MSNYLSQEYKVANPPQLGDVNLARSVMSTLQGRYDTNKALIDQTLNAYNANLKGLRPEDNSYIASRLRQVKTTIDQYSLKNGNLAYSNNSNSILSAITSLMDDPLIQDAITSKQNYTNLTTQYQKIQEKTPELANEANLNYALYKGGYQDYMQGKTNKLGSMQYTPYVDLREKHLKDLKTIKDLKGKRFIEEQAYDTNGVPIQGALIKKEIDGLTYDEIRTMFEGQLSPQEQQQMTINGWSKYAQPNNIESSRQIYAQYVGQLVKNKEQDLTYYEAQSKNNNLGEDIREDNRRKYEQLNAEIENYKNIDVSQLDAETIAYNLEKAGYVNNISQIASTEWSTSIEKDPIYYANQDLEIKREQLNIAKIKLAKELGVDASGNPIASEQVYQSSISTELQKEMEEEGAGYAGLNKMHEEEVESIINKGKTFLENASEEDRSAYVANLKKRGLDENLNWIEGADSSKGKSTAVYEAFQEGNFASTYAEYDMSAENERKRTLSKNIYDVNKDATLPVFNENPDKYINFLKNTTYTAEVNAQSDLFVERADRSNALATKVNGFVNSAGGWNNLKKYLNDNPNKIAEFANLTDEADRYYKGIAPFVKAATVFGAYNMESLIDQNLKEDAKQKREEIIQKRTQEGTVMSSYNAFNFAQPETRERILRMIPNERVVGGGMLNRDKNANITVYKQGDNIILTQEQKGQDYTTNVLRVVLDKGDAAYNEISKYIDLKPKTQIKVDKNFSLTPSKVNLGSFSNNSDIAKKRQYSIQSTFVKDPNLLVPFQALNAQFQTVPSDYATKETAIIATRGILRQKGIPDEKIQTFTDKLFSNLNTYRAHTKATNNITATGYKPVIEYKNPQGRSIETIDLGDNITEVNKELLYLINNHPQVFLLNQILLKTNINNIDEKINSL